MEEIKLSKTQKLLYEYILKVYAAEGKFIETNRQLSLQFGGNTATMKYNIKVLHQKGLISCNTVVEPSGYVIRYITPKNV